MDTYFVQQLKKEFGKNVKILKVFSILYAGWECDSEAALILVNDEKKIIGTNHGGIVELGAAFLESKIQEYEYALENTQKALEVFLEKD